MDDPESLLAAMKGCYGVFAVTNFWEHGGDGEVKQGKNLVDAAKKAGCEHFLWSTLDNGDPQVPHFVTKWQVDGMYTQRWRGVNGRVLEEVGTQQDVFVHWILPREFS